MLLASAGLLLVIAMATAQDDPTDPGPADGPKNAGESQERKDLLEGLKRSSKPETEWYKVENTGSKHKCSSLLHKSTTPIKCKKSGWWMWSTEYCLCEKAFRLNCNHCNP